MKEIDLKIRAALVDLGYLFPVTDAEIEKTLADCAANPPVIPPHLDNPLIFMKMELIKTKYDGKKALIIGNHPHKDCVAICIGAEWVSGLGRHGMKFKRVDTDEYFYVFDGRDVRFIT